MISVRNTSKTECFYKEIKCISKDTDDHDGVFPILATMSGQVQKLTPVGTGPQQNGMETNLGLK